MLTARFLARACCVTALLGAAVLLVAPALSQAGERQPVVLATIDGPILPPAADYLARAVKHAEEDDATCLLVRMDTPGGRDDAMRQMARTCLSSRVPVVVWVAPSGARAGSAGAVVSLAANVLAIAPGANIGAAHPVTGEGGTIPGDMREKVTNDAAALARSIAQQRGRNAQTAEAFVRQSVSLSAQEALQQHVADLVVGDRANLLRQLEGRTVVTAAGPRTLHTQGAPVRPESPTWLELLLAALFDPNVALILGTIAFFGIMAEINHPGAIFPGVAGGIALILSLYSFSVLSVNAAGAALVVLAMALFITDIYAASHGVLTAGGIVSFVAGSMMLFNGSPTGVRVSIFVIVPLALLAAAFFGFVLATLVRSRRQPPQSGAETLIGTEAEARTALDPEGQVFVDGALWSAVNVGTDAVNAGDRVIVEGRKGLVLRVHRSKAPEPGPIWSASNTPG